MKSPVPETSNIRVAPERTCMLVESARAVREASSSVPLATVVSPV